VSAHVAMYFFKPPAPEKDGTRVLIASITGPYPFPRQEYLVGWTEEEGGGWDIYEGREAVSWESRRKDGAYSRACREAIDLATSLASIRGREWLSKA